MKETDDSDDVPGWKMFGIYVLIYIAIPWALSYIPVHLPLGMNFDTACYQDVCGEGPGSSSN